MFSNFPSSHFICKQGWRYPVKENIEWKKWLLLQNFPQRKISRLFLNSSNNMLNFVNLNPDRLKNLVPSPEVNIVFGQNNIPRYWIFSRFEKRKTSSVGQSISHSVQTKKDTSAQFGTLRSHWKRKRNWLSVLYRSEVRGCKRGGN